MAIKWALDDVQMPHESTVDHDGSELSADDESDSPMAVAAGTASSTNYLHGLLSTPHVPHIRPETPKQVTHHHDDDDDDDDDPDIEADAADDVRDDTGIVVNGNATN